MNTTQEKLPFLSPQLPDTAPNNCHEDADRCIRHHLERKRKKTRQWTWILLIAGLCCLSAFIGALGSPYVTEQRLDRGCLARSSRASPLTADVEIKYDPIRFNVSLLKENIYRKKGSPEVDAAWSQLGVDYRSVIVPASEAARVGLRSDQVKVQQEYGGGFPANVEGLHHLHCLNLIRQGLYYNVDYYRNLGHGAFQNSDYILQKHMSHCLDIIRQQLMCSVDIGVMGQVWFQPALAANPEAYVDFNTEHVCRNFEDIRDWAEKHQGPAEIPADYLEPPQVGDRVYTAIP
ncbi:hypothetical protein LTR62_007863 [Meristemomyces frigidus]|uniref:Tat pathway signal sequence n=1 Tax=Meristemomyces frigidus TaxID=1508187 RepID=A0AAN7TBJ5_9PEZI|nr:hypothetical protein LTR62_007863 [Meristemomyces frigidus]